MRYRGLLAPARSIRVRAAYRDRSAASAGGLPAWARAVDTLCS